MLIVMKTCSTLKFYNTKTNNSFSHKRKRILCCFTSKFMRSFSILKFPQAGMASLLLLNRVLYAPIIITFILYIHFKSKHLYLSICFIYIRFTVYRSTCVLLMCVLFCVIVHVHINTFTHFFSPSYWEVILESVKKQTNKE